MKKTVIFLVLVTVFSKLLGFIRDIALSYFYGATVISDVYLISLTIPTVIFAIIGKGVSTGFVPMYTRIESREGTGKANEYANNVLNLVLGFATLIVILGLIFTKPIVEMFASGFSGEALELAVDFTRVSLLGVYFTGSIYVFNSFLQTKEVFVIPAIIGLPSNLIVIVTFIISSHTNVYVLAIGSVIAIGSQFVLLIIFAYKSDYRYKPTLNLKDQNLRKMMLVALPTIFGSSIAQINILVDRTLASRISVGGVSALNYADTINLVVLGVGVASITTVLYPKISRMAAENKLKEMKSLLAQAIRIIFIFVLPASVIYMVFAEQIVRLLYGRGQFSSQAAALTSTALFYYAIGLIGISLQSILSSVFYSLQDTKTPMKNAGIAMLLNIVLNLVLSRYLGIGGLALATSISVLVCSMLLFVDLIKKIGSFEVKGMAGSLVKILIASVGMGAFNWYAFEFLAGFVHLFLALLSACAMGVILYFWMIHLMRVSEANLLVMQIKKKILKMKDPLCFTK